MDDDTSGGAGSRGPTEDDLVRVARALNEAGADYAVIGGIAMQLYGAERATKDLDLLVDPDPANVTRVCAALGVLEDRAALEVDPGDVARYTVVRIADEIVVDLLGSACGVTLDSLSDEIRVYEVQGEPVRFLSPEALIRTKQTVRPHDAQDVAFLRRVLANEREAKP